MTQEQITSYYGAYIPTIGNNAVSRMLDGNVQDAMELARNAAHLAFVAYPSLRESI